MYSMPACGSKWCKIVPVLLLAVLCLTFMSGVEVLGERNMSLSEHPADMDANGQLVIGEVIVYLAGWQQGAYPIDFAIRAAYLWQNGEHYHYDSSAAPPMCWILPLPGEGEGEGEVLGEMLDVPAGWFEMGDPWDEGNYDEVPVHEVYLDAYRIGRYEVTNREFVDVLNWAHGQGYLTNTNGIIYAYNQQVADTAASSAWSQITYSGGVFGVRSRAGNDNRVFSMENHPMVEVSWFGAVCYCNWLSERQGLLACYDTMDFTRYEPVRNGYRLPTEAEWERAAAWDGDKHWRYGTTSNVIDRMSANYPDWEYMNPLELTSFPYTSPVGWYNGMNLAQVSTPGILTVNAASPVGAYDMTGNAGEWCHDWYNSSYYDGVTMTNPLGPSTGTLRVLRGGSWDFLLLDSRSAYRNKYGPDTRLDSLGFRVAVSGNSGDSPS